MPEIGDISLIVASAIGAIPATIAAVSAALSARASAKQVKPSNGHRLAEIVELTADLTKTNHEALLLHIHDQKAHAKEQHDHFMQAEGTCPNCLGLTEKGGD